MAVSTPYPIPAGLHDDALIMKASSNVTTSAAVATIIDLGPGVGHRVGVVHINATVIDITDSDEIYDIIVQGAASSTFATATAIVDLAQISLGDKAAKRTDSDRDDAAGNRRIYFDNLDESGTPLRYIRIYTVVTGASAAGITYSARLSFIQQAA